MFSKTDHTAIKDDGIFGSGSSPTFSSNAIPAQSAVVAPDYQALMKEVFPFHYYNLSSAVSTWERTWVETEKSVFEKLPAPLVDWLKSLRTATEGTKSMSVPEIPEGAAGNLAARLFQIAFDHVCNTAFLNNYVSTIKDTKICFSLALYLHRYAPQSLLNDIFSERKSTYPFQGLNDAHWAIICRQPFESVYCKFMRNYSLDKERSIPNPLVCAIVFGDDAAFRYFLNNPLANVSDNMAMLHAGLDVAAAYGHVAVVTQLIAQDVSPFWKKHHYALWDTPITYAMLNGQMEVVKTFIEAGGQYLVSRFSNDQYAVEPDAREACFTRLIETGVFVAGQLLPPVLSGRATKNKALLDRVGRVAPEEAPTLLKVPLGFDFCTGCSYVGDIVAGNREALSKLEAAIQLFGESNPACRENWLDSMKHFAGVKMVFDAGMTEQNHLNAYNFIKLHMGQQIASSSNSQEVVDLKRTVDTQQSTIEKLQARLADMEKRFAALETGTPAPEEESRKRAKFFK